MQIAPKLLFYLDCLRPRYLAPNLEVRSIAHINPDFLKERGIKGLVFDVDNTLTPYHGHHIDGRVEDAFRELARQFKSCIISNATPERRRELQELFELDVVQSTVRKPFPDPFYEALSLLDTSESETAMVGDRLLTDVAGANKIGMFTVKVNALNFRSEPPHHTLVRFLESSLLRIYQEEGPSEKTFLLTKNH